MLKRNDIERFYQEVGKLDLKFPVAAIAKATGESKGNVSRILNKKLAPSESFLKRFNEKFSISIKNVPDRTDIDMTTMTTTQFFGEKGQAQVTIQDLLKKIIQLEAEKKMLQEMIDKLLQKR